MMTSKAAKLKRVSQKQEAFSGRETEIPRSTHQLLRKLPQQTSRAVHQAPPVLLANCLRFVPQDLIRV